jgi:class 3 adenylate cyclase/tetratricopeptide (TPR) repeat protein
MKVCPSCGEQSADKAKFCSECATPLSEAVPRHEERKVVTVLFADLVGFTSRSEAMDVEDVRGTLQPYHQLLRRELERFGGTVEKFIGDAVMALFGAPVAHEDDPERAVRSALAIQDAVAELRESDKRLDLHVRIGVNTGEALVALGARPSEGEGMASGDVVNTAARLQSAAPVDGVLVGEVTYRGTSRVIEYEEAEPIQAKGKTEPVRVWVARQARSRLGSDVQQAPSTPLVGREKEVDLLWAALDRARTEQSPQLVTLVGVPGIGKSRLVWELFRRVENDPDLITWRQGRSLPYGEGVAFWALGEMVKAQAGVLHSDSAGTTGEKLHTAVADLIHSERDATWVEGHLRPLLGLETGQEPSGDRLAEAFAAWRRFIEGLAERGPTVLVFEDLHWADDALLDFIDHLVEWASGVPLLVVGTARPELLERRKSFGGGTANAVRVALSPLTESDTARLVGALLEQAVLPAETQTALLERAEGNPLYAEEYVRMLIDRDVLIREGRHWRVREGKQVPLPESVQGIIAARLDALSPDEKSVLQAASVMGKVVWLGAVEVVDGVSRWRAEDSLHRLEQKEFVRRERRSSVEDETEYAFRHILVRDVAYGQIPRAERAEKHQRAAEWIESLSGDRGDRVEMLAHHYLTALELARAAGQRADLLSERARQVLIEAGERSLVLNAYAAALQHFESALMLSSSDHADRGRMLLGHGRARAILSDDFPQELVQAREALVSAGDLEAASDAEHALASWVHNHGKSAEHHQHAALELLRDRPNSLSKATALTGLAGEYIGAGQHDEGIALCEQAVAAAEDIGSIDLQATARNWMGIARLLNGDVKGRQDIEESLRLTNDSQGYWTLAVLGNAAQVSELVGDIERCSACMREVAQRAGMLESPVYIRWSRLAPVVMLYCDGNWRRAGAITAEQLCETEAGRASSNIDWKLHIIRGRIAAAKGESDSALSDSHAALQAAREQNDLVSRLSALAFASNMLVCFGDPEEGRALLDELTHYRSRDLLHLGWAVGDLVRAALAAQYESRLLSHVAEATSASAWMQAAHHSLQGSFDHAAHVYAKIGSLPDEAYARLRAGRQLIEQGRRSDGEAELERSLAFWRQVEATAYIRECEGLLARVKSA